jgi:hypothetical protein
MVQWAFCIWMLGLALPGFAAEPAAAAPDPNPTLIFSQFSPTIPFKLVAYGDTRFTDPSVTSGTNPRVRKWLAERIGEERPAAALLTGDTPYTGAKAADWQEFQKETASWHTEHILVLPTMGNHETYGGRDLGIRNYQANFPEIKGHLYYSALLGNVEVISMDATCGDRVFAAQSQWFAAQLDHMPGQVQFLLILFHIPWMADSQSRLLARLPGKDSLILRGILEGHLAKLHAKVVVFNGHLHNYERFERKGVEYVVTGGGGAEPYPLLFRGSADLYQDTAFPVYHFLTLDVRNGQLHAVMWKVKDSDAAVLEVEAKDQFTLTVPVRNAPPRVAHQRKSHVSVR